MLAHRKGEPNTCTVCFPGGSDGVESDCIDFNAGTTVTIRPGENVAKLLVA